MESILILTEVKVTKPFRPFGLMARDFSLRLMALCEGQRNFPAAAV
jgi:hypothetical protein